MVSNALHKAEASVTGASQQAKLHDGKAQKRAAVSGGF
jgi:hypothetical protein